jgi:hypothetical protein
MQARWFRFALLFVVTALMSASAYAQGTRSTLSGVVMDTDGGVLPGVTVVVTSGQTGTKFTAITNERGIYSVPALDAGAYTATFTLSGFKTTTAEKVVVVAGNPASLNVTMGVGAMEDKVSVTANGGLVQTQNTTVATVMTSDTLKTVPFVTRNLMDSMTYLVGIDRPAAGGDSRDARVNGLPGQSIALSMDGVSIKSAQGEADFYAYVFPTIDSVEQVTVSGATQGADSSGGSASVRFVTRSGTQRYTGSFFDYIRHEKLNSNYYFNEINGLPKNRMSVNQFGATVGGPIIPGRGAFFFVSWEELIQPISETNTRTILSPQAQQGLFRYDVGGVINSVNLYALAAANAQTSVGDAITTGVLATIRGTTEGIGLIRDTANPNTQQFLFQDPGLTNYQHLPAGRVDINLTSKHKLTGNYRQTHLDRAIGTDNRTNFPGLPGGGRYDSRRTVGSIALRSILSQSAVSELVVGWQNQNTQRGLGNTIDDFDWQGGFVLGMPLGATAPGGYNGRFQRKAPLRSVDHKITWQAGAHSWGFGGSWSRIADDIWQYPFVPSMTFGVQAGLDPADAMFTTANFPNANNTVLTNARALYSFLTGHVNAINGNVALEPSGRYMYLGRTVDQHHLDEFGLFAQDQWRISPTTTLNYGLRYGVQLAGVPDVENYTMGTFDDLCGVSGVGSDGYGLGRGCSLGKPGTLTGSVPTYDLFSKGTKQWNADVNNLAPNLGIAWRPNVQNGWLRTLLGDPEQATIRASFSVQFNTEGTDRYRDIYTANPGRSRTANRSEANGNLVLPGQPWPLLFSQTGRLGPPAVCTGTVTAACYPETLVTPFSATVANPVAVFDRDLHAWYSRQFAVGLQRALSKDTAIEVRYVGTRSYDQPSTENWNEPTLIANGYSEEFKRAQANLYANIAAGRGQTFAYTGALGTVPLPIFLASYNASSDATNTARYTGSNWTSSTNLAFLQRLNPNPAGFITGNSGLYGSATFRANGVAAGLPRNFWVMNPDVSNATYLTNTTDSRYNSFQVELRQRLSRGLQFTSSYSRSFQDVLELDTITRERVMTYDLDHSPNAFKFLASYEIPVGQGRAFGSNMSGVLNAFVSNWNVSATSSVQTGIGVRLSNIRLVGMTEKELQKAFKIRTVENAGTTTVYSMDQDIIDNTIKAFSTSVTGYTGGQPTGRYIAPASTADCVSVYRGDCGAPRWINLRGPMTSRVDLSFRKQFHIGGSRRLDLQYDILNVFAAINYIPVFEASADPNINQVTEGTTSPAQVFDPGGRLGQVVVRFVW